MFHGFFPIASRYCAQRALTAFLAAALRSAAVIRRARALPPFRPSAAAAGSFRFAMCEIYVAERRLSSVFCFWQGWPDPLADAGGCLHTRPPPLMEVSMAKRRSSPVEAALAKLNLSAEQTAKALNAIRGIGWAHAKFGAPGKQPSLPAKDGTRKRLGTALANIRSAVDEVERADRETTFLMNANCDPKAAMVANGLIRQVLWDLHPMNLPYVLRVAADRLEAATEHAKRVNKTDNARLFIARLSDWVAEQTGRPHDDEVADLVSCATGRIWTADDVRKCCSSRGGRKRNRKLTPQK